MTKLHQHLQSKSRHYKKWHNNPYHQHLHWLTFVLAFFISSLAILSALQINLDEQKKFVLNFDIPQAQAQAATSCWDPIQGHCYPRTGIQQNQNSVVTPSGNPGNSNGAMYNILARYDLVLVREHYDDPVVVNMIKNINPDAIVLATFDRVSAPSGYRLKDVDGNDIRHRYNGYLPNYLQIGGIDKRDGARQYAVKRLDALGYPQYDWDGFSQDSMNVKINYLWPRFWDYYATPPNWATIQPEDIAIDWNEDGVNDWTDPDCGEDVCGEDWINDKWRQTIENMYQAMRDEMDRRDAGKVSLTFANSGNKLKYWYNVLNGHSYEGWMRFGNAWNSFIDHYIINRKDFLAPEIRFLKNWNGLGYPEKENYKLMRYGLAAALLDGAYYGMQSDYEYHFSYYYDEFDTNLGYPLNGPAGDPQKLSLNGDEVWLRYFDNGAVIVVPDYKETGYPYDVDIPASILNGTYYKLAGGQKPSYNNGNVFNGETVTITSGRRGNSQGKGIGEGIILYKDPTTMVSDIIIGNYLYHDTSPGSIQAQYTGSWPGRTSDATGSPLTDNPYWGLVFYAANGSDGAYKGIYTTFGYRVATPGTDIAEAEHNPTINIAGPYEVFEWHSWHGDTETSYDESTMVQHIITHASGADTVLVNQRQNIGQWNSLGVYDFDIGSGQGVTISAEGSDGYIISDAIKFVYQNNSGNIKTPTTPQCSDSIDNDSDGETDYPQDDGCTSASDNNETDPPSIPQPAPTFACLNQPGPLEVVIGFYDSGKFEPATEPDKKFDARNASFEIPFDISWGKVVLGSSSSTADPNMCWAGGYVTASLDWHDLDISWDTSKSGFDGTGTYRNTTAVASFHDQMTWTGLHVFNVHDGMRTSNSENNWIIQHVWLDYIRDDCLENDRIYSGEIYDSLFDGCYSGISVRPSSPWPAAGQTVKLDKVLMRMEPMPYPYKWATTSNPMISAAGYTEPFGYGNTFKVEDGNVPDFEITNSVFLYEYDSQKRLFPDQANVTACSNNTIIWLDDFAPAPEYLLDDFPGCFTIYTDKTEGQAFWQSQVADWHNRHPNVGAARKPANPGVYTWPRYPAPQPPLPPGCTCPVWTDEGCGLSSCPSDQMSQIRTCTPAACGTEQQCTPSASCSGGSGQCTSDFNCDSNVTIQDFGILLSAWGKSINDPSIPGSTVGNYQHPNCTSPITLDLDSSGIIDSGDLSILLPEWGGSCS